MRTRETAQYYVGKRKIRRSTCEKKVSVDFFSVVNFLSESFILEIPVFDIRSPTKQKTDRKGTQISFVFFSISIPFVYSIFSLRSRPNNNFSVDRRDKLPIFCSVSFSVCVVCCVCFFLSFTRSYSHV